MHNFQTIKKLLPWKAGAFNTFKVCHSINKQWQVETRPGIFVIKCSIIKISVKIRTIICECGTSGNDQPDRIKIAFFFGKKKT